MRRAVFAVLCVSGLGAFLWLSGSPAEAALNQTRVPKNLLLRIASGESAFIARLAGGGASAEVVSESVGGERISRKGLTKVRYEPFSVGIRLVSRGPFERWISDTLEQRGSSVDGSVTLSDVDYNAVERMEFSGGSISEIVFPAFDARDKLPGEISVTVQPAQTRWTKVSEKLEVPSEAKGQALVTSNFRFELDGIDTSGVARVGAFSVKQLQQAEISGAQRDRASAPGSLEFGDLSLTVLGAKAEGFKDWFQRAVVEGNSDAVAKRRAAIVLLSQDLKSDLIRISFEGVGIRALRRPTFDATADASPVVEVTLYVERAHFGEAAGSSKAIPASPPSVKTLR